MRSGKEQPFLSEDEVRTALESLLYTSRPPETGALQDLLLVDFLLADPDFPHADSQREFAVQQILTRFITNELAAIRAKLGLTPLLEQESLVQAENSIRKESELQNYELTCWNLLYYRYVRVDLGFSWERLSELTHVEPRTLRRYLNHAIKRLTQKLIGAEWEARQQHRRMKLYASLPFAEPLVLFGRQEAFHHCNKIMEGPLPHHVQISGVPGIGKTTFVQEMVRRQIDQEQLDQVIWIKQPSSIRYVLHRVREELLGQYSAIDLKEYTLYRNVAVIIDGEDRLDDQSWQVFFSEMSNAFVYLISRQRLLQIPDLNHVTLRELDPKAAQQLLAANIMTGDVDVEYLAEKWYAQVGGNPLALRLIAHNTDFYETSHAGLQVLDQLFGRIYEELPGRLKRIWILLSMLPSRTIKLEELQQIWDVEAMAFNDFLKSGLVGIGQGGGCRLSIAARHYIQTLYDQSAEVKRAVTRFVLAINLAQLTAWHQETIEHILIERWPEVDIDVKRSWLHTLSRSGHWQGHFAERTEILEEFLSQTQVDDIELYIELGRCYRHIGERDQAQLVFQDMIAHCGQTGLFAEQGRALLELGILLRQQGQYGQALSVFGRVEQTLDDHDDRLAMQLQLELAQIALDQRRIDEFEHYAEGLPLSPRLLSLRSTASLLEGDLDGSVAILELITQDFSGHRLLIGQVHAAMGRIYEQRQQWQLACEHAARAVSVLEQEKDLYALARAQANFGAVLIRLARYGEAIQQLEQAAEKQRLFKDRVALAATNHNLRIARQHYSVDRNNKSDKI